MAAIKARTIKLNCKGSSSQAKISLDGL